MNENRITAYQFAILRTPGRDSCEKGRARVCLCVLDTYRQSEIYVARGESGALKYYRFASRLHIHAWASEDEDGKTEIEREREREKWRNEGEKRDEKAGGEDKEELDGVEEKYGEKGARGGNRNGETWRVGGM